MDTREQQINDVEGPRKNGMNLEFYAQANYLSCGKANENVSKTQELRNYSCHVPLFRRSYSKKEAKKEGREEGRMEGFQRMW